jgi:iron(III) transport system substrate-binding protein
MAAQAMKEVVVYTSVDDVFARPIAMEFEKKSGIKVKLVPDTEETKSTGLLNRLIAEKNKPQADVFWSGDPVRAAVLKKNDVSTSYQSKNAIGLPELFSDSKGHWTGFSARARVLIYNKNLVKAGDEPKSVLELTNSKFKGRACIANPLFGTTSMHAVALFEVLGEKAAKTFFEDLLKNKVKLLSSNGEVRRRVSAGDCAVGITDTDDAAEAIREGKPIAVIYPDADGMGTLIVPNAAVLISQAPHATEGKLFIDYLLSAETEKALAESDAAQMPVRAGVKIPSTVRPLNEITPMKVNYEVLGAELEKLSRTYLKDWVERMSR